MVAQGVSTIMSGRAQAAGIARQNQEAYSAWLHENNQRSFSNAREVFDSANNMAQQLERNSAIYASASENRSNEFRSIQESTNFQQAQASERMLLASGAMVTALSNNNLNSSSGSYKALSRALAFRGVQDAAMLARNASTARESANTRFNNALTERTYNTFLPNIALANRENTYSNPSSASSGAFLSGALQIGGAFLGRAIGGAN